MSELGKTRAKKKVEREIKKTGSAEEAEEVARVAAEAASEVRAREEMPQKPGQQRGTYKRAWSRKELDDVYGVCEFTPETTQGVTIHGIRFQLISGVNMLAPTIVRDVYLKSRRGERTAAKALPERTGFKTEISLGAGGLEPEQVTKT